ncbi:dihydroneopterin aldolase [Uliginosibacterium sediminicola]|uniref:dihydroneopterin aldolase n=1 Tax=Uliginosibacterium sediminicola TaxID=2024550 RepID=A0ABU9YX30_9RHOO
MDFIFVEGLQLQAWVGIYPREQAAPQSVEINLTFGVPDAAAEHDDIADTIDYDKVVCRIRELLAEQHFNLLETLGEFLIGIMFEEFGAPWVRLSIAKLGVLRGVHRVGVYIERGRDGVSVPPRV